MAHRLYLPSLKEQVRSFRSHGFTHRELAARFNISPGTACVWTKNIQITSEQKEAIQKRKNKHIWTKEDRANVKLRLRPFQFKKKYTAADLIQKIQDFYLNHDRIPLKRELNAWHTYEERFGSWNEAIRLAGFETNPVLFAKKFTARDGHACDSFSEKLIDDWLHLNDVAHERTVRYGKTKYTADFKIGSDILIEFFGLAGIQKQYDRNIEKKRVLAQKLGFTLVEIYPHHLYPLNKLASLIHI